MRKTIDTMVMLVAAAIAELFFGHADLGVTAPANALEAPSPATAAYL